MNIYEKEIHGTDEIFNEIKGIVEDDNLGNRLEITMMFSAAQREYKTVQLKKKFEERVGRKFIRNVIILDEESAIVSLQKTDDPEAGLWYQPVILNNYVNVLYETLEQALIGMVCLKTNNDHADVWVNKMLGIDTESE